MSDTDLDLLIEAAAVSGQIAAGMAHSVVAARTTDRRLAITARRAPAGHKRGLAWTPEEDAFVRAHLADMSDAEIGRHLGRTHFAVHVHRERDLRLPVRSKGPDIFTLENIAAGLGTDNHTVTKLVNRGQLPARPAPFDSDGRIRVVERRAVLAFCVNPLHWMMFHTERIGQFDGKGGSRPGVRRHLDRAWWLKLRALIERRQTLWGNAWWKPGQVAEYRGCSVAAVNKAVNDGRLPAVRWGNWWVLRSDATQPGLKLVAFTGKGGPGQDHQRVSPRADAFLVLAAAAGLPFEAIGAMMKRAPRNVEFRLRRLRQCGRLPWIIRNHRLPVLINRRGDLLADWKRLRDRFSRLARTMDGLRRRRPLGQQELRTVRSVLSTWAHFYAHTKTQRRLAKSCHIVGKRQMEHFAALVRRLRAAGIDPYRRMCVK